MVVVVGVAEAAAVADGGFDAEAVSDWGFDAEAVSDWGFDGLLCAGSRCRCRTRINRCFRSTSRNERDEAHEN